MSAFMPDFLIIGAQKSGSTYVHGLLRAHPDIFMPAEEVRVFEDPEYGDGGLNPLRELFRDCPAPLRGIKRPDYLARPEVPERIRKHIPDAKLISVLRQPVERLVSAYYYYIKLGFLPVLHINEGLRRILDGDNLGSQRSHELLEYGRYATHLERYLNVFPRHQLLIVLQEEIARAPLETGNRIFDFLGAKRITDIPRIARDNSGVYPIGRLRLLTRRNIFLYSYDHASKLVPRHGWWRRVGAGAITACDRWLLAPVIGNQKPTLDPQIRIRLQDYYRPEIKRLEGLLEFRLDGWNGTA